MYLPTPPFGTILVYDVSRWGRFQDSDEAAAYEFTCGRAGIVVAYCAEPFDNDGSPLASMLKAIKRTMAAEYSRELSVKVKRAQCNLIRAGFKQGGSAGYGLRRQTISACAKPGRILEHGERKSIPTDRVRYVLGPRKEVSTAKRIYAMYIDKGMADCSIAVTLNEQKVPHPSGRWSDFHVKSILTNPKYTGT
ncbi:recombinase family protein [Massilia sp. TWR1-2-2]|uniref:recombinase family protein n=1 Tax=Massilia sp. TWR1-2-2 TaxID=2804584 RepID=UPI003CEFCA82